MELSERLAAIRDKLSMTQDNFSKIVGTTRTNISRYEKGSVDPPSAFLHKLVTRLNVSPDWLLTGRGEMFEQDEPKLSEVPAKHTPKEAVYDPQTGKVSSMFNRILDSPASIITLGGEIAAGEPATCIEDFDAEPVSIPKILLHGSPAEYCILRVKGRSMEPFIMNDDLVLIRYFRDWDAAEGKVCAVRVDGEITLKEVQIEPESEVIFLHPYNHKFKTIVIQGDRYQDVFLVGIMEALIRTFDR